DDKRFAVTHTDEEWRRLLSPEQYQVLRRHGTEAPGSCALNYEKRLGTFACAGCGQPLFVSKKKFESGTGWPSFNDPVQGAGETPGGRGVGRGGARGGLRGGGEPSRAGFQGGAPADASALLHQRRRHEL